jgi:hypothetical protein
LCWLLAKLYDDLVGISFNAFARRGQSLSETCFQNCPRCGGNLEAGFAHKAAVGLSFVSPEKLRNFIFVDEDLAKAGFQKYLPSIAAYFRCHLCRSCQLYLIDYSVSLNGAQAKQYANAANEQEREATVKAASQAGLSLADPQRAVKYQYIKGFGTGLMIFICLLLSTAIKEEFQLAIWQFALLAGISAGIVFLAFHKVLDAWYTAHSFAKDR